MEKVALINTASSEEMRALYNPEELTERITAQYTEHKRLRGSPMLQYTQTQRQEFKMTFYIDDADYGENPQLIGEFRRFISSLLYPVMMENGELRDPPDVLFTWSKDFLVELCRVMSVNFRFTRFTKRLVPKIYTAEVTMKESGYTFISSQAKRNDFLVLSTL